MIGTSLTEWIIIRFWILVFRYTPLLYLALLYICLLHGSPDLSLPIRILTGLLAAEAAYYALIYLPCTRRLSAKAVPPEPLTPAARRALFEQCMGDVEDLEHYLRWWFQGADMAELRRDNLREFFLWAFFDLNEEDDTDGSGCAAASHEIDGFIAAIEKRLGRRLLDGRGDARCIRLTLDDIETAYRGLLWYAVMFLVDQLAHLALWWHGFDFYARPPGVAVKTFPPRPQELLARRQSPAPALSYYHRPHRSGESRPPVVFIHGIGVGLWTYVRFLADLAQAGNGTGLIAIEVLPVCFRLTPPHLAKADFLRQMTAILDHHGWHRFALASHSYGSVPTTHIVRCPKLQARVASVVLIDPVTITLQYPDVAYNFTRRRPCEANEWQLWYFARTDPGVAYFLGRHFFWQENIIWREDLLLCPRVVVCLAGCDMLVDTSRIARYLAAQDSAVKVVMFPALNHGQAFDSATECRQIVQLIHGNGGAKEDEQV